MSVESTVQECQGVRCVSRCQKACQDVRKGVMRCQVVSEGVRMLCDGGM